MQYDAATPGAYLEMLEDDWRRERLLLIREMFLGVPGVVESMSYKMLGYHRGGAVFGHLNAQKGFVGVYLGDLERIDPGGVLRALGPRLPEALTRGDSRKSQRRYHVGAGIGGHS